MRWKGAFELLRNQIFSMGRGLFHLNQTNMMNKPSYNYSNDVDALKVLAALSDIYHICETGSTFVSHFKTASYINYSENIMKIFENFQKYYSKYNHRKGTLLRGSHSCEELVLRCVWEGNPIECKTIFNQFITDYGFCCKFNSIPTAILRRGIKKPVHEEGIEDWVAANLSAANLLASENTRPRKIPYTQKHSGRSGGPSFLLHGHLDEYLCSSTDSKGFVMGTHLPIDYPKLKETGFAIATGQETFVGVHPEITMTEDSVSSFSLNDRQCYYGNEYSLAHYTKYTSLNCMSECIARKTMEECKCRQYYMPDIMSNHTGNTCHGESFRCPLIVQQNIMKYKECKECLPTCTEIKYQKEVTSLKLHEEHLRGWFTKEEEIRYRNQTNQMSLVHVYFNVDSVQPRLRKQVTSTVKLLSSAGGLLGLCMGFGVLSLLEIVYFFTVRLCFASLEKKKT